MIEGRWRWCERGHALQLGAPVDETCSACVEEVYAAIEARAADLRLRMLSLWTLPAEEASGPAWDARVL